MATLHLKKRSVSIPGHRAPAVGFEAPFEMLGACHERVERMLDLLERINTHLQTQGSDESARQAARDVIRYFDLAAPLHHQDEERHVFPPFLKVANSKLRDVVDQLLLDHRHMEAQWSQLRMALQKLIDVDAVASKLPPWCEAQAILLNDFVNLYRQHLQNEEQLVYPAAKTLLSQDALHTMSQDMMRRRGLALSTD